MKFQSCICAVAAYCLLGVVQNCHSQTIEGPNATAELELINPGADGVVLPAGSYTFAGVFDVTNNDRSLIWAGVSLKLFKLNMNTGDFDTFKSIVHPSTDLIAVGDTERVGGTTIVNNLTPGTYVFRTEAIVAFSDGTGEPLGNPKVIKAESRGFVVHGDEDDDDGIGLGQ